MAAAFVCGASAETPEGEIRRAILQLGDDEVKKRDAAEELLREIGPEAALLYRPDDQGKDPEIRRRMRSLLEAWQFGEADSSGKFGGPRIGPWIAISDEIRGGNWQRLEDDRIPEELQKQFLEERAPVGFLSRPDIVLSPRLVTASLAALQGYGVSMLANRANLNMSDESRKILLEYLNSGEAPEEPALAIVLWRLGEKERMLKLLADGTAPRAWDKTWDALVDDPGFCTAMGTAFEKSPGPFANKFRSEKFAKYYREQQNADALATLSPEVAAPLLRELVNSDKPAVRLRAALALAAWNEPTEALKDWDNDEAWKGCWTEFGESSSMNGDIEPPGRSWPTDVLARVAATLPSKAASGDGVENRLRKMVSDPPLGSMSAYAAALRGLAARKRARDITYIYEKMQILPPADQCDLAVDLARMGSSGGVGLLVPRLYEPGWAQRRDANEALKQITGQDFFYNPAGTLPERCRAARKWATWWRENKTSFHPDVK